MAALFEAEFNFDDIFNSDTENTDKKEINDLFDFQEINTEDVDKNIEIENESTEDENSENNETNTDNKSQSNEEIVTDNKIIEETESEENADTQSEKEQEIKQNNLEEKSAETNEKNHEDNNTEELKKENEVENKEETPKTEEKPKRRRRSKNQTNIIETKKEKNNVLTAPDFNANEIDNEFAESLLVALSPEYIEQKKKLEQMMNDIDIRNGMSQEMVKIMIEKNTIFQKFIFAMTDVYENAYNNLTENLMAGVRAEAELAYDGTKEDKKNAGTLALMNYVNLKNNKPCNLLQYAAALKTVINLCKRAEKMATGFSVSLSSMVKIFTP